MKIYVLLSALALTGAPLWATPSLALQQAEQQIANFHEVEPNLIYRGGNPIDGEAGLSGLQPLVDLGVKTVIDLQGGDLDGTWLSLLGENFFPEPGERAELIQAERAEVERLGMKFEHLPLDSHADISDIEGDEIQKALQILSDPQRQPVFIHCEHGSDRTGLVIAIHRVLSQAAQGWTVQRAMQEWRDLGHGTLSSMVTGRLDAYFYRSVGPVAKGEE